MKCQELMVGDFCRSGHGLPMHITNVGDDYAYATFEGNEGDPWEFDDKDCPPEPIEITGDLLKVNGWGACSYNFLSNLIRYYYVKDEGENHLIWERGILTIWSDCKKYNDGVVADIVISCKYVHQIQQVLRLAGMTELAIILKYSYMKQPKLYIKNEKGRYEEYQIPDLDISDTLFSRINGKYVPVSTTYAKDLPEGVWVVTRDRSCIETIRGQYLKELMKLEKASDLKEMPSLAELGGWQKCAQWALDEIGDFESMTMKEIVYAIVGKVYEYSKREDL